MGTAKARNIYSMRILIVEDNDLLGDGLQAGLKGVGFAPDWVRDGEAAWHALSTEAFAALVLDLGLPKLSGIELLKRMRSAHHMLPVLILTARDAVADRIAGLDAGADDYLIKPCDLGELAARLRALIRRTDGHARPLLEIGPLQLDPAAHTATYHDQLLDLSAKEFALLHELAREAGRVLSRDSLAQSDSTLGAPRSNRMRLKSTSTIFERRSRRVSSSHYAGWDTCCRKT